MLVNYQVQALLVLVDFTILRLIYYYHTNLIIRIQLQVAELDKHQESYQYSLTLGTSSDQYLLSSHACSDLTIREEVPNSKVTKKITT